MCQVLLCWSNDGVAWVRLTKQTEHIFVHRRGRGGHLGAGHTLQGKEVYELDSHESWRLYEHGDPILRSINTGYSVIGSVSRLRLKCDGTRAETRFRLSAKRTSPFKSAGTPVQSTTGIRGVRIRGSNAGYTKFRGSVKRTGYPLHSPVSPSLPLLCVTVCHHISTGLYQLFEEVACLLSWLNDELTSHDILHLAHRHVNIP